MSITAMLALAGGTPMARYEAVTHVAVRCSRPEDARAIVVCGRRAADRWRVPFLAYDLGDPRAESVSAERNRLASEPRPTCGTTAFFATACSGMVGVTAGIDLGGGVARLRPLAE